MQSKQKTRHGEGSLGLLWFTIFMDLLGFGIIIPILPVITKQYASSSPLGINPDFWVGLVVLSFSFMQLLFSPTAGILSDKFGRRPVLLVTIVLTACGSLLFGLAQGLIMLLISRLISGLGSANIPTAQAYIADITPPEQRAQKMGLIGAAFGLGFIFGPALGALLVYIANIYQWNQMLTLGLFSAALSAINFILALLFLPESLKQKSTSPSKGLLKSYQGLGAAFKTPIVGKLFIINLIFISAFVFMQTNAALLWKEHYLLPENQIYLIFGIIGLCTAIVQGLLIKHFQRILGLKKMLILGTILDGLGLTLMPLAPIAYFWPVTMFCIICLSMGNGMIMPSLNAMVSSSTRASEQGKTLGLFQGIGSIGRVIGPAISGALYVVHYTMPYLAAGLLMLVCLWLAWQLILRLNKAA